MDKVGGNHSFHGVKEVMSVAKLKPKGRINNATIIVPLEKKFKNVTKEYIGTDIFGYDYNYSEVKRKKVSEEKAAGIWIRITGPFVEGKRVVREICYPSNFSKKVSWKKSRKKR